MRRNKGVCISHEWIYQYIYVDKRSGGDLYCHLRWRQKARRKRYGTHDRRGIIPHQASIDERPTIVGARRRFGDWEGDTVIRKGHRGALATLAERTPRYIVIRAVRKKRPPRRFETLSRRDSCRIGPEFIPSPMMMVASSPTPKAWLVTLMPVSTSRILNPYTSWECGLNENTNGLICQYFPKYHDLTTVTSTEIEQAMDKLNHRPRKVLGLRIPQEVFSKTKTSLTVAL